MTTDTVIQKKTKTRVKLPSLWKVVFLNDDKTPMDLVVGLLIKIFKHDPVSAEKIMLEIHNEGRAVAGVYPYEIAEHRCVEATNIAKTHGSPLQIRIEEEK
jgi:ATP-dependent Clp protease adaptor protein ClpS